MKSLLGAVLTSLLMFTLSFISVSAHSQDAIESIPTSATNLIRGFTQWQANRIERVIVDQAIDDIARQAYIQKFFTQTVRSIDFYDSVSGQRLIPLIQSQFKTDILLFDKVTLCLKTQLEEIIRIETIDDLTQSRVDQLDTLIKDVKELVDDNNESMTTVAFLEDRKCDDYSGGDNKSGSTGSGSSSAGSTTNSNGDNNRSLTTRKAMTDRMVKSINKVSAIDINNNKSILDSLSQETKDQFAKNIQLIKELLSLIKQVELSMSLVVESDESYVFKAYEMLQIIDLIGSASADLFDFEGYNISALNRLKSISLFLAELADASDKERGSADAVVAILDQYVNENDTYNSKRLNTSYFGWVRKKESYTKSSEDKFYFTMCTAYDVLPCQDTLFLTSYYGLSFMKIDETGGDNKDVMTRAYGPVGVEFKLLNYRGSSLTLGYAPIDLGNYITAELKGDAYDPKIEDILSPSVFISWSFASKPLSLMAGYQEDIRIENGLTEDAYFISVAFDLPIATIY